MRFRAVPLRAGATFRGGKLTDRFPIGAVVRHRISGNLWRVDDVSPSDPPLYAVSRIRRDGRVFFGQLGFSGSLVPEEWQEVEGHPGTRRCPVLSDDLALLALEDLAASSGRPRGDKVRLVSPSLPHCAGACLDEPLPAPLPGWAVGDDAAWAVAALIRRAGISHKASFGVLLGTGHGLTPWWRGVQTPGDPNVLTSRRPDVQPPERRGEAGVQASGGVAFAVINGRVAWSTAIQPGPLHRFSSYRHQGA